MNVFYNKKGIGDTLLISLTNVNREQVSYEKNGDVARLFDTSTNETVGYHIFQISKYFPVDGNGSIELTESLVGQMNDVLKKNGVTEEITADLSPKFVVGLVLAKDKHPNADKLSVCRVDVGGEELQIVCGAPNVDANQKVVVAKVGAVMPGGMVIKDARLRGVDSSGMICSAKELALPDAPEERGILVLTDDYTIGQEFPLT